MLDDRGATDTSIFILPFSLQPGDAEIVGQHIRNALDNAPLPQARTFSHERGTTGDSPFKGELNPQSVSKQKASDFSGAFGLTQHSRLNVGAFKIQALRDHLDLIARLEIIGRRVMRAHVAHQPPAAGRHAR